jgi:DnaJ-class molecular chaperone
MSIVTRPATKEYRDNFDATFGKTCGECEGSGSVDRNKHRVDFDADGPHIEPCPTCKGSGRAPANKPQVFTPECSSSCVIVGACTHVSESK